MNIKTKCQDRSSAPIAAAAVRAWEQASVRLCPVIGEQGFAVLYRRSLHLASAAFPWLSPLATHEQSAAASTDTLFSELERRLAGAVPEQAALASRALHGTFTGLLNTLIGERLTAHLFTSIPQDGDSNEAFLEHPK